MPIPAQCQCGARFAAPDHLAGKSVACPTCKQPLKIPAAAGGAAKTSPQQPAKQAAPKQPATKAPAAKQAAPQAPAAKKPAAAPTNDGKLAVRCACGASFAAPANLAGKRVACPTCKQPVEIPAAGKPAAKQPAAAATARASQPQRGAQSNPGGVSELLDELGIEGRKVGDNYCPECEAVFPADAMICVNCGYNRKSGRKLSTVKVKAPTHKAVDLSSAAAANTTPGMPASIIIAIILHFLSFAASGLLTLSALVASIGLQEYAIVWFFSMLLSMGLHGGAGLGMILQKKWGWRISVGINGVAAAFWILSAVGLLVTFGYAFIVGGAIGYLFSSNPEEQALALGVVTAGLAYVVGFSIPAIIFFYLERALLSKRVREYVTDVWASKKKTTTDPFQ